MKLLSRPSGTNLGLLVRVPHGETLAGTLNKETLAWYVADVAFCDIWVPGAQIHRTFTSAVSELGHCSKGFME